MVGLVDIAHRHGRDAGLVADLVGKGRLEHAAIDRAARGPGLASGDVDQVGACRVERARDLHRLVRGDTLIAHPVGRRDAHRHRPLGGPDGAHRREHFERIAQAILEAAAILIGARVLERRDEAGEQISVRGMEFDHVEPCVGRHARGRDELVADFVHVRPRHRARGGIVGAPRHIRGGDERPIALGQGLIHALPADPGRALGARMTKL